MGRRAGGRGARVEARAAALPDEIKPVRMGLAGNNYKSLGEAEMQRIHRTVLEILSTIGLKGAPPSAIEYLTRAGAEVCSETGRLLFSSSYIEDVLAKCNRRPLLAARDPVWDIHPYGDNKYTATAGAAVNVVDVETSSYRDSTLQDLYDSARIADELDHVHYFQRTMVARDILDPLEMDINTLYACLAGTRKHVGSSWTTPENFDACLPMIYELAGGEKAFRERPFVSMSNCYVVPPLQFTEEACHCLERAALSGMPVLLLSAGQAGATAPASLALSIAQQIAECLAGVAYMEAVQPGAPFLIGPWPFVVDLRTGMMCGGSGEQALLMSGCGQMGRFYDLPTSVTAGMTDAKLPDSQSGYEKGYNYALVLNSGANSVQEAAGMHASLLGFCMESMVLDNDALGAVLRTVRGIEVNEDNLDISVLRDCNIDGPGHYLAHNDTVSRMQRDYYYPEHFDRFDPKLWQELKGITALDRAKAYVKDRLANHHPEYIPPAMDQDWRRRFPIKLSRP